ncbi:UDP-2,3-diacylglucosamine diphosphatase [Planctomycetota bacterium]
MSSIPSIEVPRAILAADTHLDEHEGTTLLEQLLKEAAARKAPLFILGDFINLWFESHRLGRAYAPIFKPVKEFVEAGGEGYFIPGNRDFLARGVFHRHCGLQVLPEVADLTVAGTPYRLLHGDQVYLGDRNYRIYRQIVRNGLVRGLLRILPDFMLRGMAGIMQRDPEMPEPDKQIDVDLVRFSKRIYTPHVSTYICGHVHRSLTEKHDIDGHTITIRTLNSWVCEPEYFVIDEDGIHSRTLEK